MTRRSILFLVGFVLPVVTVAGVVVAGAPAGSDRLAEPVGVERDAAAAAIADMASATTASQRPALADGAVSLTEYRAAADRTVACLGERLRSEVARRFDPGTVRVEVGRPRLSPDGFRLTWTYGFRFVDGMAADELSPSLADVPGDVDAACQDEHLDDVQAAYQLGRLADDDFVREVDAGFVACLRRAGVDVPDGEDARSAMAEATSGDTVAPAVVDCVERFPAVVGDPGR